MTDAVSIALITSGTTVLLFVLKDVLDKRRVKSVEAKVEAVHKDVNGKMEKLLLATGAKEHAEGKAEGKTEQRNQGDETAAKVIEAIKNDPNIDLTKTQK